MSLKVGHPAVANTSSASSRTAAINRSGPTGLFRHVSSLSGASPSGPEDESLHFGETWDDLQDFGGRSQRKKAPGSLLHGVRFGDILTTEDISSTLMKHQAMYHLSSMTTMRVGSTVYERSMRAIANNGVMRPLGTVFSWVL